MSPHTKLFLKKVYFTEYHCGENEQAEDMYELVSVQILDFIFDQIFSKTAKTIYLKVKI